jgi:N-methylhydantoinase A
MRLGAGASETRGDWVDDGAGLRLGVDVGGTFTDVVAIGGARTVRAKVSSTPRHPARGVLDGCRLVAEEMGLDLRSLLGRVTRLGLGTTVVTNVLATRSGRRLGLVTTAGFEDLIPLARGNRVSEEGWLVPPPALVERERVMGVQERTTGDGNVLVPVDAASVLAAGRYLIDAMEVEAIVVSFLWSFRNPGNEQQACAVLREHYPSVPVLSASALSPVIREYDRTQYALLNAYVSGALDWLDPLAVQLADYGLAGRVVLTHSSGGATTVSGAMTVPIGLAQSGPAAGAAAACALATRNRLGDVVACDLGGTSLDVGLIADGQALRRTRGRLVGYWTSLSMVDVDSVGSGGGSVAWVDALGAIRVGPRSAGADPGPACYGRGTGDATLTDALVVLGYIDATAFLGGRMKIDASLAAEACARLGSVVGLESVETAWGIREVALAAMARAVRSRIAGRGLVASELSLLAYGGCGGLFAADIAAQVGARRSVVPELASVLSAFGAATAFLHRERAQSLAVRVPSDPTGLEEICRRLGEEVTAELIADGAEPGRIEIGFEAELRFERQGAELAVAVPVDPDGRPDASRLEAAFRSEYVRRFGEGAVALGVIVEVMTLRALGRERPTMGPAADARVRPPIAGPAPKPAGSRAVQRHRSESALSVPVHRRESLYPSDILGGPALVDCGDSTVWVNDGQIATVDESGSIILEECQ